LEDYDIEHQLAADDEIFGSSSHIITYFTVSPLAIVYVRAYDFISTVTIY